MGDVFSVRPTKVLQTTREESLIERVRQNSRAFFEFRGVVPVYGAGAFDLLENRPAASLKRQAGSLLLHGAVVAGLLLMGGQVAKQPPRDPGHPAGKGPLLVRPAGRFLAEMKPDGSGKGSNHDLLPPTSGNLALRSPMVLVRPHLPDERPHVLPVEPTILAEDASMPTEHVRDLGLPWMNERNNSNGNDGGNTMGTRKGGTMGSSEGQNEGESIGNRYSPGAYPVKCVYCPDPEYTDEARHEKLQGIVTLRVLVTSDGRAGQVKIIKGLGLGLDERAADTVRNWRFQPARDAARKPIAEWVTV